MRAKKRPLMTSSHDASTTTAVVYLEYAESHVNRNIPVAQHSVEHFSEYCTLESVCRRAMSGQSMSADRPLSNSALTRIRTLAGMWCAWKHSH